MRVVLCPVMLPAINLMPSLHHFRAAVLLDAG